MIGDGIPSHWKRPVHLPDIGRKILPPQEPNHYNSEHNVQIYNHWLPLHKYAPEHASSWNPDLAKKWYHETWLPRVPSIGCSCKSHWSDLTTKQPPDFSSAKAFFEWGWARHDDVSRLHSKAARISLEECYLTHWNLYRDVEIDSPTPHRDRLIITAGVGSAFEMMASIAMESVDQYAGRVKADVVRLFSRTQGWWGLEKFRVHKFAKQYKQTLFIDADVLIKKNAPDIFSAAGASMHDDLPHLKSIEWIEKERLSVLKSQGDTEKTGVEWLLNSGVVLCDRDTADVWLPPTSPLPDSHCAEQFWVERNAELLRSRGLSVSRLDRRFNCQWWMDDFADAKEDAWFVHYANSPSKIADMERDAQNL